MLDVLSSLGKKSFYGIIRAAANAAHGTLQLDDKAPSRMELRKSRLDRELKVLIEELATPIVTLRLAREIMGEENCVTEMIEEYEWVRNNEWLRTPRHEHEFPLIPFTRSQLRAVKETHLLVLVVPFTILEMTQMCSSHVNLDRAYDTYPFANQRVDAPTWRLIRKGTLPSSLGYTDGVKMPVGEQACDASVVVFAALAYRKKTGKQLFTGYAATTGNPATNYVVVINWLEGKDAKIRAHSTLRCNADLMITEVVPY